jgi:hypothetical protein
MKTVCSRPRIRKIVQALSESRDRRLHHLQWAIPTERRVKGGAGDTPHFACPELLGRELCHNCTRP